MHIYMHLDNYEIHKILVPVLRHIFLLFFLQGKMCCRKNAVSPRSHIYTYVHLAHMYEYIYAEIESIWIPRALQVSRPDPWTHIEFPTCSVCACVNNMPIVSSNKTCLSSHLTPHAYGVMLQDMPMMWSCVWCDDATRHAYRLHPYQLGPSLSVLHACFSCSHVQHVSMSHVTCFMSHVAHLCHVTHVNVCRDTWGGGIRGRVCRGNRAIWPRIEQYGLL